MNDSSPATEKHKSHRNDIFFTFAMALALYVAWLLHEVLMLLYVSALFAVVLMPVIRGIMRIKIGKWQPGRGMAVLILFVLAGTGISLFFLFALPPVIPDLQEFVKEMPTRGPQLLARLKKVPFAQRMDTSALNAKMQDWA